MNTPTDHTLRGRVAFVTGAGSGIGRASAERLARAGARIALVGHTPEELQEAAAQIERDGGETLVVSADVAVAEQVAAA